MATMYRGPFVGFLYGNGEKASDFVSSETLKVVRVSDSDRYTENGFPDFEERTVQVPGRDETYYFGRDFTNKSIEMSLAFDEITESEFQKLKSVFASKEPQKLIFDETPYKYYTVVANNAIEIQYLCFDTPNKERVYKGEATIDFMAYDPFARSITKSYDELKTFYGTTKDNGLFDKDDFLWYNEDIWKTELPMNWIMTIPASTEIQAKEYELGGITISFGKTFSNINKCFLSSKSNALYDSITGTVYNEYLKTSVLEKMKENPIIPEELEGCTIDYSYVYY